MATPLEIIGIIDDLLEGKITPEKAVLWAKKEIQRTSSCEDPPSALVTIVIELDSDPAIKVSGKWREELLLAREVLVRGVPCPQREHGKKVEAYWLAYTPREKVVLCQIRKMKNGEKALEVIEEEWNGEKAFYELIPLSTREKSGLSLSEEEIKEKEKAFMMGHLSRKEALQWIISQLETKTNAGTYENLLKLYWKIRRSEVYQIFHYSEQSAKKEIPLVNLGSGLLDIAAREILKKRRT